FLTCRTFFSIVSSEYPLHRFDGAIYVHRLYLFHQRLHGIWQLVDATERRKEASNGIELVNIPRVVELTPSSSPDRPLGKVVEHSLHDVVVSVHNIEGVT